MSFAPAPCSKILDVLNKKNKNISNCSLCRWHDYIFNNAGAISICVAQGYERTVHCYNSRLCEKLFEKI